MRTLQILHNHKYGGAEQHLLQLCAGLRAAGHTVEVAAPRQAWIGQRLAEDGFVVHDFDFRGHYDAAALYRLVRLLRRQRYDLIHTHLVRAAWYGQWAAHWTGQRLVSTVHDLTTWKRYPRHQPLIAVSQAVKDHLVMRGFAPERIEVVFPGARDCLPACTPDTRASTRQALGLAEHDTAVLLVGRVAEVKGHDVALSAARLLQQQAGIGTVQWLFAGQETAWGQQQHAHDTNRLAMWLGRRDDIPELLAAADVVVQPSRSEGLGLALMEACSAGKPIVASRVGGIPEVVADGVNGLLVPPEDPAALAQAIQHLMEHPATAQQFGLQARQRFERAFSIDTMLAHTLRVYQRALAA